MRLEELYEMFQLSWLDGIPIFTTNDASLARIARLSYAFIANMGVAFDCAPSDFVVLYNYTVRDFPRRISWNQK